MNWVGTIGPDVIRCSSMSASVPSGSNRPAITTGSPFANAAPITAVPRAWYSGVVTNAVPSSGMRTKVPHRLHNSGHIAMSAATSERVTPFDRPVVPPVNSIGEPACRSVSSASPAPSSHASYSGPSSMTRSTPAIDAASLATSLNLASVMIN